MVSDYAVVRGGRLPLVKASPYRVMPAILLVMPAQAGISYHLIVQGKSFPTPSPRGLAPKTPNVLTCLLERKSVPATTDTLDDSHLITDLSAEAATFGCFEPFVSVCVIFCFFFGGHKNGSFAFCILFFCCTFLACAFHEHIGSCFCNDGKC